MLFRSVCFGVVFAPLGEVEVLLGHAQFLSGDAAAAIATYSRSLETFPGNTEARYARAAATLDTRGDDATALAQVKPWAVDVSSGVERDGHKDNGLIAAFVALAKDAPKEA